MKNSKNISKTELEESYYGAVALRWNNLGKTKSTKASENGGKDHKEQKRENKSPAASSLVPDLTIDQTVQSIQLLLSDDMIVMPKAKQTTAELRRNIRRSRVVRVKSIISYIFVMLVVILVANIIWQVILHPDMSLNDWIELIGSYFK